MKLRLTPGARSVIIAPNTLADGHVSGHTVKVSSKLLRLPSILNRSPSTPPEPLLQKFQCVHRPLCEKVKERFFRLFQDAQYQPKDFPNGLWVTGCKLLPKKPQMRRFFASCLQKIEQASNEEKKQQFVSMLCLDLDGTLSSQKAYQALNEAYQMLPDTQGKELCQAMNHKQVQRIKDYDSLRKAILEKEPLLKANKEIFNKRVDAALMPPPASRISVKGIADDLLYCDEEF